MTNDQAIKILNGAIKKTNTIDGYLGQALTMAIEALNCSEIPNNSDTISRQSAIDVLLQHPFEKVVNCISILEELPSVQPRRGKWILDNPHSEIYRYTCSECHAHHRARYDFCPSCGADMRPQFEEPEINPCRGCEDYDGKGGCKTKGGCADRRGDSDE